MGIFDDDSFGENSFESIFKEFFGQNPEMRQRRRGAVIRSEEEDRLTDFIETNGKAFLIIELPGFSKKDVMVSVKGRELEIKGQKQLKDGMQPYLVNRFAEGIYIKKILPDFIMTETMKYTMNNGILEMVFDRKK